VLARLGETALHRRDFEQKVFDTSYYVKPISVGSRDCVSRMALVVEAIS